MREVDLPTSWTTVPIDEVLSPLADGRLLHQGWSPQCDSTPAQPGEWGVLKTTAVQAGWFEEVHNKRLPDTLTPKQELEVKAGDILLTCAGPRARCGVATLVRHTRPRLILSGKMYRFRADPRIIDPRYLEHFLISPTVQTAIDQMKTGISDSGLNLTHARFNTLQISLAPLPEQERIVSELERRLSHVDAAQASLTLAAKRVALVKSSLVDAAVSGRLLESAESISIPHLQDVIGLSTDSFARGRWRSVPAAHVVDAPPHWESARLADLAWDAGYGTSVKCGPTLSNTPVLRIPNVTSNGVDLSDMKYAPDGQVPVDLTLKAEDLLFVRTNGSRRVIGRSTLAKKAVGMSFASYLIRFRLVRDPLVAQWVALVVSAPSIRSELVRKASNSAGQFNLGLADIAGISIPFPPREEMEIILLEVDRRMSLVVAAESVIEANVSKCGQIRRSLLAASFAGNLVPQDPDDEPAEVLLERVRVARAATQDTPAPRRRASRVKKEATA